MRLMLTVCLAASMGLAADPGPSPEPGDAAADLKSMQGTWTITKWTYQGKDMPEALRAASKFAIAKDQLTVSGGKAPTTQMTLKLNPRKKPAEVDLVNVKSALTLKGIYKLNKDELTIVYQLRGKDRPMKFDDGDAVVWVLKREK